MQNFVLQNPTTVIFGTDTVKQIGRETSQLGKKALLVYGRESIRKSGLYDTVKASLENEGVEVTDHSGVQSNPVLGHVRQGIETVKKNHIDVIVAVGGGSVIDSAKAIGAGSLVDHDVWQFFRG
ncbi:MAG: iron-containing alcohol dehydrogenase, partial [Desulfobulbaceae bacterium]|nr:iron-containing alcohol dehydrogenase [Candidatus Desulfobia pelagia]